jgi:hypothetical protein
VDGGQGNGFFIFFDLNLCARFEIEMLPDFLGYNNATKPVYDSFHSDHLLFGNLTCQLPILNPRNEYDVPFWVWDHCGDNLEVSRYAIWRQGARMGDTANTG